ncbi:molybdenum cofactor guanylyltransferase [Colwellia sp. RSH04]|uniref:molybdenum cofactor guanylyltransferase n=1 Tax=Colwellia sp. RSH04 TaxID=2305464 RepID=UPI000E57D19B|nr:NTP transferase domain-containing protein [Colwellia sp. RSH04]RHW76941.1 molybdenum cofactor guanylyltransferase [Colwellia sp. RSH04]
MTSCLGVVLAGGLSSRMGKDKSKLLRKNQESMLNFSRQLLHDSGLSEVVISGDEYQIPDAIKHSGPVGGIYSVLYYLRQQQIKQPDSFLILPVDLPLMTASALTSLRLAGELKQKATFFTDTQNKQHNIPLFLPNNAFLTMFIEKNFKGDSLITKTVKPASNQAKNHNKQAPSIRALLKNMPHQSIALTETGEATNILFNSNTPQDWQLAQQQFTGMGKL